jgi:hypothetical protein
MHQRALVRAAVAGGTIALIVASACSFSNDLSDAEKKGGHGKGPHYGVDGGLTSADASTPLPDAALPPPPPTDGGTPTPPASQLTVTLVPDGVTGMQRVNFAVPFALGQLTNPAALKILAGTTEVPAARRGLAKYADGSLRSVQVQVDVDVATTTSLTVQIGVTGATGPALVDVATTLAGSGNNVHPKVWVRLPSSAIASSGLVGPIVPRAQVVGTSLDAWSSLCDYDAWDTDAFLVNSASSRDVWLFDRVTAMYRGYGITGDLVPLRSAYREAGIYRAGMTITNGVTTAIAPPDANTDLKYHYSQGMALHYLLTGDDRYREAAEAVSARVVGMWNPQYDGADRFWTERHAGFALLAHEWAAIVSDDKAATIAARADAAVTAFLSGQDKYPVGYTDTSARCFAHTATAHGEDFGYTGCSPWMSAILADGLDAYARRVGGTRATQVRQSIAKLGRSIARDGLDSSGKPYYWMGVGNTNHEIDDYDEHWGEAAYIIAMAWDATGRTEAGLKTKADALVAGLIAHGEVGQVRSFNWQCRSAVMAPAFLK